jgi:uncharacterized repeat protein (TIGR01451 family)
MFKQFYLNKMSFLVLFFLLFRFTANAQLSISPVESFGGYSIQKSVSLTNPRTEDPFFFNITFTANGNIINITDNISSDLIIDGIIHPSSYGGNPVSFVQTGNTITVTFPSGINGSISGSFQVNVHFPAEGGCTAIKNSAKMKINETKTLTTLGVEVRSTVNNFWHLQKYPIGEIYLNTPCRYGTLDDSVTYELKIVKNYGTAVGAEQLSNISLKDILGASGGVINIASFQSSVIGASINAAGDISFPPGFVLNPTIHIPYTFRFKVGYTGMSTTSCVTNTAELRGDNSCTPIQRIYRDSTTIKRIDAIPATSVLTKYVSTSGNLPGCTGTYTIRVRNTSAVGGPTLSYLLRDTLPSCITVNGTPFCTSANGTIANASNAGFVIYQMQSVINIPPQSYHDFVINFTIGNSCGTSVTNRVCGTVGGQNLCSSATFYLLPNDATPCILKTVCAPTNKKIGDTVRFRIRVQNIGGTPLLGSIVSDNIDNNSLEYIPNSGMYYGMPNALAVACTNGITTPATSFSYIVNALHPENSNSVQLSWKIDNIPVACSSITYPVCGSAYYLPAYYIEFACKVKDTAGIGNIKNTGSIGGGNILVAANVANYVTFLVNGIVNYSVEKLVSSNNGTSYATTATVAPGALLRYKLKASNLGIGIIRPVLVDLLPMDNGANDNFIKHSSARGSNRNVFYNSFVNSSHAFSAQLFSSGTGITTFPELGITVGTTPATWTTTVSAVPNIRTDLSAPIGVSLDLAYVFNATLDPSARVGDRACNSFAMRGLTKNIINFIPNYYPLPAIESNVACVEVAQPDPCCHPYAFDVPRTVCLNYLTQFCAKDSCPDRNIYTWDFGDGSLGIQGICVSHAYTSPGVYTIKLVWLDTECGKEESQAFEVVVEECRCKIDVSFSATSHNLDVTFDGTATVSTQPIALYVWDFGDGTVGTGQIVNHSYNSSGAYTVTLTVYSMGPKGEICECVEKCSTDIRVRRGDAVFYCNPRDFESLKQGSLQKTTAIIVNASPNPFKDRVTVSFEQDSNLKTTETIDYSLELLSANGMVLQTKKLQNLKEAVSFDAKNYGAGLYIILLKNVKGIIQNKKVIKL